VGGTGAVREAERRAIAPMLPRDGDGHRPAADVRLRRVSEAARRRYAELRERIRQVQSRPEFEPVIALPTAEYLDAVLAAPIDRSDASGRV
jgi:hypothetical protein